MTRRGGSRPDDDEDDDVDLDEEEEEEAPPRRTPRRTRPSRDREGRGRPAPLRRWKRSDADEGAEEPSPDRLSADGGGRRPIYWRARDSLWFEPLVALAVIVVLLVALFAYTQNWPPVYVVESNSMQHGSHDIVGLINTGDLVLAQRIPTGQITPYFPGIETGYSTYGEYGDVLLYHPNGGGSTPIIHRAIILLVWNASTSSYSAPSLSGLPCDGMPGPGEAYATPGTTNPDGCNVDRITGTLDLFHVGWRSSTLSIDVSAESDSVPFLGEHTGFLTLGDNNTSPVGCSINCTADPDQPGTSQLVASSWILGVARGMLPWFGAFKLLLTGSASEVPLESWEYIGITLAGVILAALGLHYLLRAEGVETELRRQEEEAEAEEEEDEEVAERHRRRRWLESLRPWKRADEAEEEEPDEPPSRRRARSAATRTEGRRGRPRPHVRRDAKSRRREDDDEL